MRLETGNPFAEQLLDGLPGDGWTEPDWIAIPQWPRKAPRPGWSAATLSRALRR